MKTGDNGEQTSVEDEDNEWKTQEHFLETTTLRVRDSDTSQTLVALVVIQVKQ